MSFLLRAVTRPLPRQLRDRIRLAAVHPDPQDGELAAVILDDGRIDPEWTRRNSETWTDPGSTLPIGATTFRTLPRLATPDVIAAAQRMGMSDDTIRALHRSARFDQARYPQLFARLTATRGT